MALHSWAFLSAVVYLIRSTIAVSVCDEVNVVFLIDTASIIHNEANIIRFIDSIIVNGSSEFTGFSAVSYGHHIPLSEDPVLFHLNDTKHIAHRRETQRIVHDELMAAFESIKAAVHSKSGRAVPALEAVRHGQSQHFPAAKYRKHELLGKADDYTMGQHDDDTIFIVFDWTNQLLSNHQICEMYAMADAESAHFYFLFGQHLDESIAIHCRRGGVDVLRHRHSFHHFDEARFVEDSFEMQFVFNLTCPAFIQTPKFHGHLGLHRSVQWIDPETITECDLHSMDGVQEPDRLDSSRSYVIAKDFVGDGNTFKVLDHLMADPVTFERIQQRGCAHPIYKITKVMRSSDLHHDLRRDEHYHILKLYVMLPLSMTDYVHSAKISSFVHEHSPHHRRLAVVPPKSDGEIKALWNLMHSDQCPGIEPGASNLRGVKADAAPPTASTSGHSTKLMDSQWCLKYNLDFPGSSTGMLSTELMIHLYMDTAISYEYSFWNSYKYLKMTVEAEWFLFANLNVDLLAHLKQSGTKKIFDFSKRITISIGKVPLVIKPFIQFNMGYATEPLADTLSAHFDAKWIYGRGFTFDYEYNSSRPEPETKEMKTHKEVSQRNGLTIDSSIDGESSSECPLGGGVSLTAAVEVGLDIYKMLKVRLQPTLTLPITVKMPETVPDHVFADSSPEGSYHGTGWWLCDQEKWYWTIWWELLFKVQLEAGLDLSLFGKSKKWTKKMTSLFRKDAKSESTGKWMKTLPIAEKRLVQKQMIKTLEVPSALKNVLHGACCPKVTWKRGDECSVDESKCDPLKPLACCSEKCVGSVDGNGKRIKDKEGEFAFICKPETDGMAKRTSDKS